MIAVYFVRWNTVGHRSTTEKWRRLAVMPAIPQPGTLVIFVRAGCWTRTYKVERTANNVAFLSTVTPDEARRVHGLVVTEWA